MTTIRIVFAVGQRCPHRAANRWDAWICRSPHPGALRTASPYLRVQKECPGLLEMQKLFLAIFLIILTSASHTFAAKAILEEDYNQWKQALGTNRATGVENIAALPAFKVELIRSAQTNEGSW